jgi:peptidoglycan/LPS O-acetylase OafA/YrhL
LSIARPPIPVLTGVRGVAALTVTIAHYCNSLQLAPNIVGAGAGQLGVMLFFALSGFLMGYLYCDWPSGTVRIKDFAVARLARVGPLFVLVVMLSWICATYLPSPWDRFLYPLEGTASLASHLLLLDGVDVLWTIPVEIHFYLIFALGLAASGRVPGAVSSGHWLSPSPACGSAARSS